MLRRLLTNWCSLLRTFEEWVGRLSSRILRNWLSELEYRSGHSRFSFGLWLMTCCAVLRLCDRSMIGIYSQGGEKNVDVPILQQGVRRIRLCPLPVLRWRRWLKAVETNQGRRKFANTMWIASFLLDSFCHVRICHHAVPMD